MSGLLVTGADGFVGRWLVRAARADGRRVVASVMPGVAAPAEWDATGALPPVEVLHGDFRDIGDVERIASVRPDAVIHLAAIASGSAARENPELAHLVNGVRSAAFAELLSRHGSPTFLFVSTGEIYGPGHDGPIPESAACNPQAPYASSKAEAEAALRSFGQASRFPVIIARAFPHTGPGQSTTYVLPALASRLKAAKRTGEVTIRTGNLSAVRDFLDVRDVVRAYLLLLDHGRPGEVYNVASGVGRRLADCFASLALRVGVTARPVEDAALLRSGDIPVLIGDPGKLIKATGWTPQLSFERTLQDLVDAQAD